MVVLLAPAAIVPVNVPLRVPVPVARLSETPVAVVTFEAVPPEVCDCTVTLNAVPAVGLVPPLTAVIASFVGEAAATERVPFCAPLVVNVSRVVPLQGGEVFVQRVTVTENEVLATGVDADVVTLSVSRPLCDVPSPGATTQLDELQLAPDGRPVTLVMD